MKANSTDGLLRARPAEVGVDADVVAALLDDAKDAELDVHSLLIYRSGHLAVEAYRWPYRADRPRIIHSVTKSFTACAIGLALSEGRLALSDKVISFFPEHLSAIVDANLAVMTVRDLLTMRTGHAEETSGSRWRGIETSWIAEFFKIPVLHNPGAVYVYTSAASYMLSAIITRATGQRMHDYLKPRLFEPLGIVGETWDMGPDGINPGGNGLNCKVVDLLKLGILHLQKGVWEGKQALPEAWVDDATRTHGDSNYGYQWVTGPEGEYYAMGLFGQLILVAPAYDAVMTFTSAINDSRACSGYLVPLVHKHLSRLFADHLPNDADAADARLEARLRQEAEAEGLVSLAEPRLEYASTLIYNVDKNSLGVEALYLSISRAVCTLRLIDNGNEYAVTAGIGSWLEGETNIPGARLHHGYNLTPLRVVAGGRWLDPDTLELSWIFAETTFRDTVVCRFAGNRITVSRRVNVNSGATHDPDLEGKLISA
jgi:CubicO group peptidase (beta-lactamase class C family)